MGNPFHRATKEQAKLRMALIGPSGSGKTYSALRIASALRDGQRIALVDTERGSASKYADLFDFDVLELSSFAPETYIQAIKDAQQAGYAVLVLDSLSHAWMGKNGILELVDREAARAGGSFQAWRIASPKHNALVDAMLQSGIHLIVTMRSKMEYVMEEYEEGGKKKTRVKKVGLQPVQRDGLEYEFDVVGDMDLDNNLIITKTRCPDLTGKIYPKPGEDVAGVLNGWLSNGATPQPKPAPNPQPPADGNGHGEPAQAGVAKAKRPLTADQVLRTVRAKSGWQGDRRWTEGEPATDAQVGLLAGLLGKATRREGMTQEMLDKDRHAILSYLIGIESTRQLTRREASALIDWLVVPDTTDINGYAQTETAAILKQIALAEGQTELEL